MLEEEQIVCHLAWRRGGPAILQNVEVVLHALQKIDRFRARRSDHRRINAAEAANLAPTGLGGSRNGSDYD